MPELSVLGTSRPVRARSRPVWLGVFQGGHTAVAACLRLVSAWINPSAGGPLPSATSNG